MDTDFNNYFDETHFDGVLTVPEQSNVITGQIILETSTSVLEIEGEACVVFT